MVKLHSTKYMSSEEDESDIPHLFPFCPIIDGYIDDFALHNFFADAASQIELPLLTTAHRQPISTRLEFSAHAHLAEAFHSLKQFGLNGQRTLDLAPASEHFVMVLSLAFEAPDARFSAQGFLQDNRTVEVDIRN